jgi:hypothetical protein
MEVKWFGINNSMGHIIQITCNMCSKKFKLESFGLVLGRKKKDEPPQLFSRVGVDKLINECPKCKSPVFYIEFCINVWGNEVSIDRVINGHHNDCVSPKTILITSNAMKGTPLSHVAKKYNVSQSYVSTTTRAVFKRLLPNTWNRLSKKTRAIKPTMKELLPYYRQFIINLGPHIKQVERG